MVIEGKRVVEVGGRLKDHMGLKKLVVHTCE